jgi:hypothetical protein
MRVTVEIPDGLFRATKSADEVNEDVRRAATAYWIARGDVAPEDAAEITTPVQASTTRSLAELLAEIPPVGDDTDFARDRDFGREPPTWAS